MKVIGGMATIPSRQSTLERVLDSLTGQLDELFLALNYGNVEAPKFLDRYPNVFWWHNDRNKGDSEKFAMAHIRDSIFLGCDDDLIYPEGYADKMKAGVEQYNGLISLHGRTYLSPVTDFRKWAGNYRCLGTVSEDVKVNMIGSGVCAFNTNRLRISLSDFHYKNMSDVFISREASRQGVPMVVLAHKSNYLGYTFPKETIWNQSKDFSHQTFILQSYIK
jgi:hypothetical protein